MSVYHITGNVVCYLQHVHHLLKLSGFDARGLLHGEALEVLNDAEAIDLSLFVLQKLLQDYTVGTQNLTHNTRDTCYLSERLQITL